MKTNDLLRQIIADRKRRNPRLSLRSIAAKMNLPSGRVSELLAGKRQLTHKHLDKFCAVLKLSEEEKLTLKRQLHVEREAADSSEYRRVFTEEQMTKLTDWKPYALMCFLQTSSYSDVVSASSTPEKQIERISEKLHIDLHDTTELIRIMTDVQLISWNADRWEPTHKVASVGYNHIPSKVIQQAHHNVLDLAKEKLSDVDVTQRDFSFMTITVDPDDLEKARKMIRTFRRRFATELEKGLKKEVYQIAIQFFPISTGDK